MKTGFTASMEVKNVINMTAEEEPSAEEGNQGSLPRGFIFFLSSKDP